jgi:hypothetical protein
MLNLSKFPKLKIALAVGLLTLAACTPKYDWRQVRSTDAPYTVMLPAKPATHTRPVTIDGAEVAMVMTAAEVDGTVFAVGTAELSDAAKAHSTLAAMKMAMLKNIDGQIKLDKTTASGTGTGQMTVNDVEAVGPSGADSKEPPRMLVARFVAKDKWVYQAIVIGQEKAMSREAVDTFLASFKVN